MVQAEKCRSRLVVTLLAGTGLVGILVSGFDVTPAAAQSELPALEIQGSGAGGYSAVQPSISKLTEPLANTPVSVDTITHQLIEDRGETTLNDALRNAPGITLGAGEFLWQGNAPYIRGFSARTDMFLDGMRDFGDYYRDPWNEEKVEVLEGPDSILFGRGSTGGVINQVSKSPQLDNFTSASLSVGTADTKRATIDYNTTIDGLGAPAALRLNAMGTDTGTAEREVVNNSRYGFAGSLAVGLGTPNRFQLDYFHQSENDIPDYGLPWYFNAPAPVSRENYYGYHSDFIKNGVDIVTGKYEHDFSGNVTLREQVRYANYSRAELLSQPRFVATLTASQPLDTLQVGINSYSGHSRETEFENQIDLFANFDTVGIRHDIVTGVEYDNEYSAPEFDNSSGLPTKSLVAPDISALFNPTATYPRVRARTTTNTIGLYAMDTVKFGDNLQVVLGVRWDSFGATFDETTYSIPPAITGAATATTYQDHTVAIPSWRGALVYKPAANGTVYFSFGTSFNPSAEGLSFLNSGENYNVANENLGPEKNLNFEIGTKWLFLDDRLDLSTSLFRSEKTNARIPDPTLPGFNMLGGNQRVDGFELLAQGQIASGWNISLGYDYLSSVTTKTTPGGPPLGLPLVYTPHDNATFWTAYQLLPDFQIGGGGQYVSKRYAQTTAPFEAVPGYIEFDAMAKYTVGAKLDLQLNVYNLTDKYYYDAIHPHFVIPGAGRSAMLTLNFHS